MNILDLADELQLRPRKASSTKGGEYKSACPKCKDGFDRFCIWPNSGTHGQYWCRICKCHGDAIQFCRDFLGLNYKDACKKLNVPLKQSNSPAIVYPFKQKNFLPKDTHTISEQWKICANTFVNTCQKNLLNNPFALEFLHSRGFCLDSIQRFRFGWNGGNIFDNRTNWGLPVEYRENGKVKLHWLPKGVVIPTFDGKEIAKLKVRRTDWHAEDKLPKYVEISGGLQRPSIYGDINKPIVIVEAEIDAILIQQFASDICCSLALGGVSKRPDKHTHEILKRHL